MTCSAVPTISCPIYSLFLSKIPVNAYIFLLTHFLLPGLVDCVCAAARAVVGAVFLPVPGQRVQVIVHRGVCLL